MTWGRIDWKSTLHPIDGCHRNNDNSTATENDNLLLEMVCLFIFLVKLYLVCNVVIWFKTWSNKICYITPSSNQIGSSFLNVKCSFQMVLETPWPCDRSLFRFADLYICPINPVRWPLVYLWPISPYVNELAMYFLCCA